MRHKRILILILAIIFIVGCTPADKETSRVIKKSEPIYIRLQTNHCTKGYSTTDDLANEIYASDYYSDWRHFLLDEYNLDIKLHVLSNSDFVREEGSNWGDFMKDYDIVANRNGKIFSDVFDTLTKLKLIQPFTEFLENSITWKSLPTEFTSSYQDAQGNIWAIPYSDHISVFARLINKQWLKNSGLGVPNTVDELYEMLKTFTYKDPDKNGIDDTYGLSVSMNYLSIINFKDIFEANGCHLTYQVINNVNQPTYFSAVPIGFNPESGRIENYSLGIEFKESLDLISNMTNENIIKVEDVIRVKNLNADYSYFSNPQIGTYYGVVKDNIVYPDKYEYIFALDGLNKTKTSSAFIDGEGAYFLSSYANEPEKLVPAFVDTFYSSKDGFILGHYGLIGEQYKYSINSTGLEFNTSYVEKDWNIEIVGDLSWHDVDVSYKFDVLDNGEELDINNLFLDNRMFMLSQKHMSFGKYILQHFPTSNSISHNYLRRFGDIFAKFILGQINTDDVLRELEKNNKLFDVYEWIEETNSQWFGN